MRTDQRVNRGFCCDCRVVWQWLWAVPIRCARCPECSAPLHSRPTRRPGLAASVIRRNALWPVYQCGSLDVASRAELN